MKKIYKKEEEEEKLVFFLYFFLWRLVVTLIRLSPLLLPLRGRRLMYFRAHIRRFKFTFTPKFT